MAKTKKNIHTKESIKTKLRHVEKRDYGCKLRDCVIKLERLSKMEYDLYCSSNIIITKSFDIKLKGNTVETNKKKHHSSNNTFTFELKSYRKELVLEYTVQPVRKIPSRCVKKAETMLLPKKQQTKQQKQINQTEPKPAKSLNVIINDAWKKCKTEYRSSGYSAWPGRIDDFTKNGKRAHVFFFGSNNSGSVDVSDVVPFELCSEVIRLLMLRKVGLFHRAVLEIERILNIPTAVSFTKELFPIEN